jgi:hypothetical protein
VLDVIPALPSRSSRFEYLLFVAGVVLRACVCQGCGISLTPANAAVHDESECTHKYRPCRFKCGSFVRSFDVAAHEADSCQKRRISCPYGCGEVRERVNDPAAVL